MYTLLAILFLCGAITLIMKIIKEIINNKALQDNYEKNINRILKYYGDIIVTVNDEPDFTNSQIMNVQNFGDLIDVAEQNKKNIIHYEVLEKEESNLYVVIDKYVYKYVVTTGKLI